MALKGSVEGAPAAAVGPGATTSSGLGGLGLEGMVGIDPAGARPLPPAGDGKRGVMSGDSSGDEAGPPGSTAGAAEMVDIFSSTPKGDARVLSKLVVRATARARAKRAAMVEAMSI